MDPFIIKPSNIINSNTSIRRSTEVDHVWPILTTWSSRLDRKLRFWGPFIGPFNHPNGKPLYMRNVSLQTLAITGICQRCRINIGSEFNYRESRRFQRSKSSVNQIIVPSVLIRTRMSNRLRTIRSLEQKCTCLWCVLNESNHTNHTSNGTNDGKRWKKFINFWPGLLRINCFDVINRIQIIPVTKLYIGRNVVTV